MKFIPSFAHTVTCILAFGINPTSSFQTATPQRLTKGWERVTTMKNMNDLYAAGGMSLNEQSDKSPEPIKTKNLPTQPITVQGGSLRTWSYRSPSVERVQVVLSTEGRPLESDIELWHGPDNTPCKMRVYVENGRVRPFSAVLCTPRGPNTVAIRNIGQLEFPFEANVSADDIESPTTQCAASCGTIQGGALRTYPFDVFVDAVQVLLKTDGRPLNARIELLQGPNNNKQVVELYTENGYDRPFFCILKTPGAGNVIRIVNTAPIEFPMTASVVPHTINKDFSWCGVTLGGDMIR